MEKNKLYVAINQTIINKLDSTDAAQKKSFSTGFVNVEFTLDELIEHVNKGFSFCAQHNKRKTTANYIGTNVLAVDMDMGMTLEEANANPFIQKYAALIYTTPSHTPESHRFRIVFILPRIITNAVEMKYAYQGMIKKFGGDESCKDACRAFFGSKDSNPEKFGNILSSEELDSIIELGKVKKITDSVCSTEGVDRGSTSTQTSLNPLEKNQMVRLADFSKTLVLLTSLKRSTTIHCPIHNDKNPSAYVIVNKSGMHGVGCQTCGLSFWPKDVLWKKIKEINSNPFLQHVYDSQHEGDPSNFYSDEDFELHPELLVPTPSNVTVMSKKYLPAFPLHEGLTLVYSPKGTGKSECLSVIVEECKLKGLSVLLIGHRQSLIKNMATRLGLVCYLNFGSEDKMNNEPEEHYAICVDSVGKLLSTERNKYDVVIIDESEQVFAHLTADTLIKNRKPCYLKIFHYLRSAQSVILADADLGAISVNCILAALRDKAIDYHAYVNLYKKEECEFQCYTSVGHLFAEMLETIGKGGRHFISTNSKRQAEVIAEAIAKQFGHKKIMLVTSGTTGKPDVREFIDNIKVKALEYDVIIASPTLGTGVDITFANNESHIDTVFGFFVARVNTHFDIDQQLSRVRHPKAVKVWVSPQRFRFETDPEIIKMEMVNSAAYTDVLTNIRDDGSEVMDEAYLTLFSTVKATARASKNNLRKNLLRLRKNNGWTLKVFRTDKIKAEQGNGVLTKTRKQIEQVHWKSVCEANKISQSEYKKYLLLDKKGVLELDQELSIKRFVVESFYRKPISTGLMETDNDGQFRDAIKTLEAYLSPLLQLKRNALAQRNAGVLLPDLKTDPFKKVMLYQMLNAAGLADTNRPIKTEVEISKSSLRGFIQFCIKEITTINELFDIDISEANLFKDPISELGKILNLIGLESEITKRVKVNGVSARYYTICPKCWDKVKDIVLTRASHIENSKSKNTIFEGYYDWDTGNFNIEDELFKAIHQTRPWRELVTF